MDEIIVRVARALANVARLRLLTAMARSDEVSPTALSAKLKMPLNVVSGHLRVLSTAGLVQRRKSGTWCHYRVESPYSSQTLSGMVSEWIHGILKGSVARGQNRGPREVRDSGRAGDLTEVYGRLFDAATAFTDLRRLQILRHTSQRGQTTVNCMMNELSMSRDAVSRHTRKLARRGYLSFSRTARGRLVYHMAESYKSPIHARLFGIVMSTWEASKSRTS